MRGCSDRRGQALHRSPSAAKPATECALMKGVAFRSSGRVCGWSMNAFVPGWEPFAARSNSAARPTTLFELTQQPTICGSLRASFETKEREELQRKSITKWSKWWNRYLDIFLQHVKFMLFFAAAHHKRLIAFIIFSIFEFDSTTNLLWLAHRKFWNKLQFVSDF